MIDPDAIDYSCIGCAYMNRDREGGRWCSSPQLLHFLGHSLRCVWERDKVIASARANDPTIRKCGPAALNFQQKEQF